MPRPPFLFQTVVPEIRTVKICNEESEAFTVFKFSAEPMTSNQKYEEKRSKTIGTRKLDMRFNSRRPFLYFVLMSSISN